MPAPEIDLTKLTPAQLAQLKVALLGEQPKTKHAHAPHEPRPRYKIYDTIVYRVCMTCHTIHKDVVQVKSIQPPTEGEVEMYSTNRCPTCTITLSNLPVSELVELVMHMASQMPEATQAEMMEVLTQNYTSHSPDADLDVLP